MANIVLANSRLVNSGSIIGSSEASSSTAVGNLLTRDPSERWRVTDLSSDQYAQLSLSSPQLVNFAAVTGLRTTQTTQNHLRSTDDMDGANWTASNATVAAGSTTDPLGFSTSWDITATGASAEHYVLQTTYWTIEGDCRLAGTAWVRRVAGTANFCMRIDTNGTNAFDAFFDLGNGTISSQNDNGTATVIDADIEAVGDWYRCRVVGTFPRLSGNLARIVLYVTDSSHTRSYTAGSEEIEIAYPMMTFVRSGSELSDAPTEAENNGTTRAAIGWFEFDDGSSNKVFSPMLYAGSAAGRKTPHVAERPRTMAYFHETTIPCSWCRAYIDDPDNARGYFEVSRIFVDRAWQPPGNYLPGATHGISGEELSSRTESGTLYRRDSPVFARFDGELDFETEEAMFEYLREAIEYSRLAGDVLVIPDPNSPYYDTQAVWGYWEQLPEIVHRAVGIFNVPITVQGIEG